jgi:hypothetical protein
MKNPTQQPMPIARKRGLLVRELNDEVLVYDLNRDKAHCLNASAALVWRQCDGRTQISEITQAIQTTSGAALDIDTVRLAIEQLKRAHLIEGASVGDASTSRLSRRDLIKRVGIAAAVALPLVTTIVAPSAFGAASCLATGATCTSNSQCCNGTCTPVLNTCN